MIEDLLKDYEGAPLVLKPNSLKTTVSTLQPNEENAEKFNALIKACKKEIPYTIPRTKSGGFCYRTSKLLFPCFDYRHSYNMAELTILGPNFKMYRIQFRPMPKDESEKLPGRIAFLKLKNHCKKFNIDLDDYNIDNGKDLKPQIEKYMIDLYGARDLILTNVHHIDFHSSFASGIANTHPEFYDAINDLYINRKKYSINKSVLNNAIGYFHSPYNGYRLTHLARDAINDNNKRIRDLIERLKENGNIVIAVNTDGIWYAGNIYHGEGEGPNICQWSNDHINCTWRAKSKGAYEYIENGVYYPVVRGSTTLDRIKDRSEWVWGDIYKTSIVMFRITDEGVEYEDEEI